MKKLILKILNNLIENKVTYIEASNKFNGKTVIVTGASKGLGCATIKVLLQQGASVVAVARNFDESVKKQFTQERILFIKADVSLKKDTDKIAKETMRVFGKIDSLINNAGIFLNSPLEEVSEDEFEKIININLKGIFLMCKAVIPHMKKQKSGLILNIGSKISRNTHVEPNKVLYATTKYAIEGFSFALNRELKRYGIRVTCLMPGTISTFFSRNSRKFLSTYEVAKIIISVMEMEEVDFESLVFKSYKQDI